MYEKIIELIGLDHFNVYSLNTNMLCVVYEKTTRHSIASIFISISASKMDFPVSQLLLRRSRIVCEASSKSDGSCHFSMSAS